MGLIRKYLLAASVALGMFAPSLAHAIATLLPNGEQVFLDDNGNPLASGSVGFYIPSTMTPKSTWQDAGQSILNINPVPLDSAGRAIIYGSGQYRQIVKDADGNVIWDQLTQDLLSLLNGNAIVWGGTSTGSANAQIISPSPAVSSLSAGQYFAFIPGNANTAGTTLQVNATAATALKKRTTAGLQSLAANDLLTGQVYIVVYDGTQFELQDNMPGVNGIATLASASTTDLGSVTNFNISITGTTTINSFGSSAVLGDFKYIAFSGVLTLTYNATSMILPGAASINTAAGDTALAVYLGSGNWRVSSYTRAAVPPGGAATTVVRRTVTGTDTVAASDQGKMIEATSGTFTETLTAPATLGNGFWFYWKNSGTGIVTISPAAGTIDGLASFLSYPNEARIILTDGSNFFSTVLEPFSITYTVGATFTQPPGYKATMADAIAGGGGGGGGRGGAAGSSRYGGSGGGGGEHIRGGPWVISAGAAVTVTVGAAGTAGGGGSSGNGTNGGTGGTSSFGSYITAHGGVGGAGGTSSAFAANAMTQPGCLATMPTTLLDVAVSQFCAETDVGGAAFGYIYGNWAGGAGGQGGVNTGSAAGYTSLYGGAGGGGGGGVSSGNTEGAGAAGGAGNTYGATGGGGAGGATNGGVGTGGSAGTLGNGGNGGGGGGGQDAGTGGAGGAGGAPGGGGGGGAGGTTTGGAGGLGGLGQVIVWGM